MRYLILLLLASLCTLQCHAIYTPPHVPMEIVPPTLEFEVPWWLGGYVATVNATSEWILPLTYLNGGKTNIGTTLVIQNQGPFNITLFPAAPETIQGLTSYLIVADSTVQLLSAEDWIIVSNTFGDEGSDGIFEYLQADNASIQCRLVVGPDNQFLDRCGDLGATRMSLGDVVALGSSTQFTLSVTHTTTSKTGMLVTLTYNGTSPGNAHQRPMQIGAGYSSTSTSAATDTILSIRVQNTHSSAGSANTYTGIFNSMFFGTNFASPATVTSVIAYDSTGFSSFRSTPSGAVTNMWHYRAQPAINFATMTIGTQIGFECTALNTASTTTNVCFRGAAPTVGTNRAVVQFSDTGATSAGGIAWGNFEFSEYRCATNVKCNTGNERIAGYMNLGAITAPTNVAVGAFSTTISNPTLQAFGAVTANAASGTLAFTVSTAAVTCATAVVTNTNVVTSSSVQLTIQGYTGTKFTNGIPVVTRLNTAGSSSGSFTIELCNIHATNALSGNLYVSFWVLN